MEIRYLKIWALILALFFLPGCAIFVRDDGFHHHRFHGGRWHSSLQQSDQSTIQMTAQNGGGVQDHDRLSQ